MHSFAMMMIDNLLKNIAFNLFRRLQLFTAIVIYLSLILSDNPNINAQSFSDKSLHILGNFLLFGSLWVALGDRLKLWQILVTACIFSSIAESAQSLTLSRTTDPADFLANFAGALLGYALCRAMNSIYIRYQRNQ